MKSILILGRQPELGIAELESLYGHENLVVLSDSAVMLDKNPDEVYFDRLGGSVKLAKYIADINSTRWEDIISKLRKTLPDYLSKLPEGKLKLGLSCYSLDVDVDTINRSVLELKKVIKQTDRSVRVVPNKSPALNSAQVLYNQLTSELGCELTLIRSDNKTVLAQTVREQDIDAYSARDHGRPKRDSKVGMLPPKLAQIIINLSDRGGEIESKPKTVLDPFCGTGVVLQEATLMGYSAYGTDIEPRMIEYSEANLDWLAKQTGQPAESELAVKDAMTGHWEKPFDIVACETYLGRPLSVEPDKLTLQKIISDCDFIHKKFLRNIANQLKAEATMAIAVPVWQFKGQEIHLPVLDHLEEIGYTELSFVHVKDTKLIYRRQDQIVGREIIILTKK